MFLKNSEMQLKQIVDKIQHKHPSEGQSIIVALMWYKICEMIIVAQTRWIEGCRTLTVSGMGVKKAWKKQAYHLVCPVADVSEVGKAIMIWNDYLSQKPGL